MIRRLALAAALFAAACTGEAPSPAVGDWSGNIQAPPISPRLGVHIESEGGELTGSIDLPDRGVWDKPVEDVSYEDGVLAFSSTFGGDQSDSDVGRFTATWNEETGTWAGEIVRSGGRVQVSLKEGEYQPPPAIDGLDGRWEGDLQAAGQALTLVLRVETGDHGTFALMDSPDQLAMGMPVSDLAREGQTVSFSIPSVSGSYAGELSAGGDSLTGTFSQLGQSFPLELTRTAAASDAGPNRPQVPEKPYAYREEEVTYSNDQADVQLAGTLTLPEQAQWGAGPYPAAILVSGSGAQDRNEALMGHKPFLVLADHLTRKGIAVLRYDDRGVGGSGGVHQDSKFADIASDIEAGLAYLRSRSEIDDDRIGLIGHSEGGITTPMVAARDPNVAFVVIMAGPAVPGVELMREQQRLISEAMGVPAPMQALNRQMLDAVAQAPTPEAAEAEIRRLAAGLPEAQLNAILQQLTSPYIVEFLNYDPQPVLDALDEPVLAINGSKDLQVPADQNLPAMRRLFADHPDATVVELEGLNHLFQTAETGSIIEYQQIEETFAPAALNTISDWIAERMNP